MSEQTPESRDLAQQRQQKALNVVRDVDGGTLRMREKSTTYLPKMEREEEKDYYDRLQRAVLYNALKRTVGGLTGMVMRHDPALKEDVPSAIVEHSENIDQAGRHLAVFARDHYRDATLDGHACIFVDMAAVEPGTARNLREEKAQLGRPYWIHIQKEQILRVRTMTVAGQVILTRFAYSECTTEDEGEYGQREVLRVREYRLVTARPTSAPKRKTEVEYVVHTKRKDGAGGKDEWSSTPPAIMSISRIPVATTYTGRTGYMVSEPPLLDLALENINHYQVRNDRQNVLRIASCPLPWFSGVDREEVVWGPNSALFLPRDATAGMLEPMGNALEESREELKEIERRMAVLGLSMMMSDTRSAETATSKRIDKSESDSQLSATARNLQDALELALQLHAEWLGLDSGGSVEVNRDFETLLLDPALLRELRELRGSGDLTVERLWEIMQRGNLLPDDFDAEKEKELLDGAGMPAPKLKEVA
jgi:hypothetical protein